MRGLVEMAARCFAWQQRYSVNTQCLSCRRSLGTLDGWVEGRFRRARIGQPDLHVSAPTLLRLASRRVLGLIACDRL